MFAPIVTAYEHAMTEAEGRNTWRTDRYSPCPRAAAGTYLAFLASLGYQLSGIEQAVVDGVPYTGDLPELAALNAGGQSGEAELPDAPGSDPGDEHELAAAAGGDDEPAGSVAA